LATASVSALSLRVLTITLAPWPGQLEKNRPPDIPPRARDQCGLTAIPKSSLSLTPYVPIYRSEADKGAHSAAREQSENFASGTPWE
jgi:hypothetical protein